MPRVSVIIPTYNSAKYVVQAVESVISQTFKDWEIYIIDDGSTDNTREALQPYLDKITYIYQENRGPGKARNTGIKVSRGRYLAFMDADDVWVPEKLEIQVAFLDSHPDIYLVFSDDCIINESSDVLHIGHPRKKYIDKIPSLFLENHNRKFTKKIFDELIQSSFIPTSSVMIRRECVEEIGYFDESILNGQDLEMWWRISHQYNIGFTDMVLSKYRVHDSNFSTDSERRFQNAFGLVDKLASYPDIDDRTRKLIKKRYAMTHFEFGYFYFSQDNLLAARKEFLNSFKNNWFLLKPLVFLVITYLSPKVISRLRRWKSFTNSKSSYHRIKEDQTRRVRDNMKEKSSPSKLMS